jgi:hypothetical protein
VGLRLTALVAAVLCAAVTFVPAAPAESLDACAQRVIRDWYSGGRVDEIYPLRCYRAAIRALPDDVLQYSDADRDIARALAYARRGTTEKKAARAKPSPPPAPAEPAFGPSPSPSKPASRPARTKRRVGPVHSASGPEQVAESGALPYPIIGLALLSGVLLVSAGTGWALRRRR